MKPHLKVVPSTKPHHPAWSVKTYQPWRVDFPCYAQTILGDGPYLYRNNTFSCAYTGEKNMATITYNSRNLGRTALAELSLIGYMVDLNRFYIYDTLVPRKTFQDRFNDPLLEITIASSPFLLAPTHRFDNAAHLDHFLEALTKPCLIRPHNSYTDDPYGALLYTP